MADGGELLLDRQRRVTPHLPLDPGGDVERRNFIERTYAAPPAPLEKFADRAGVGPAGVLVADVGSEKLDEARRCAVVVGGDYGGQRRSRSDRCQTRIRV
jgi:hypothetical protein